MVDRRIKSWDISINPTEQFDMAVESGYVFHLTKIKLGSMVKNGKEANEVSVSAIFDGKILELGPLSSEVPIKVFDLELYADKVQLIHKWTDGCVDFSGYHHEKAVISATDDEEDFKEQFFYEALGEDEEDIIVETECVDSDAYDSSDAYTDSEEEYEAVKRPAESTETLGPDKKGKIQH